MSCLPWQRRLRADASRLELHKRLVAVVAEISAHGIRDLPDALIAGLVQRIAVFLPPSFASIAEVGALLDVTRAFAHAGAFPGGRLKFLGEERRKS